MHMINAHVVRGVMLVLPLFEQSIEVALIVFKRIENVLFGHIFQKSIIIYTSKFKACFEFFISK